MSEFTKALVVTPLADGRTWVLMEPFSYDVGNEGSGDTVYVPVKFMTDFASVPRLLWIVFPQWGKYGNAAVIHDWGYWSKERTKQQTDLIFLEGMKVLGVRPFTRTFLYLAVHVFGWWAWRSAGKRRARNESRVAFRIPEKSTDQKADLAARKQ
jgi:hypothetical protein